MTVPTLPNDRLWRGKRVLLTGHTGFKGTWALIWLHRMGAEVTGFALEPETNPALFSLAGGDTLCRSIIADLRDIDAVTSVVKACDPQIVIHMAAQPIVGRSIEYPVETLASNVMGTANLLEALRLHAKPEAILVVTSDKVYANDERGLPFRENDLLGGKDPYSASKAATELITRSYSQTYFSKLGVSVATARCGNIVGGGDYSERRIIPDVVRAMENGETLALRHPEATRPWLHVIDGVCGYLIYCEALAAKRDVPSSLNFGPTEDASLTVSEVADLMQAALGASGGWRHEPVPGSVEMKALAVESSLARKALGWADKIRGSDRISLTANWHRDVSAGKPALDACFAQLDQYAQTSEAIQA